MVQDFSKFVHRHGKSLADMISYSKSEIFFLHSFGVFLHTMFVYISKQSVYCNRDNNNEKLLIK